MLYLVYLLAFVGICYLVNHLYPALFAIYIAIFRNLKDLPNIYGDKSWVLVTGATDGIGLGKLQIFIRYRILNIHKFIFSKRKKGKI